jgi:hypothetical protein
MATPIEKVEAEITEVKANIKELEKEIKASKDRDEKERLVSKETDAVDRLKMLDARLTMLLQQRSSTTDSGKYCSCSCSCYCSCFCSLCSPSFVLLIEFILSAVQLPLFLRR